MDLLIAGGGTGGHLFPGIALAQEFRRRDPASRILFVGTERGIEVRAVPKAGFELALLPVSGLRRVGAWGLVKGLLRLPLSLLAALRLVRRFRPDVAVSLGGYAAGPAVLVSRLLGVCCVVMEQNAIPGLTNRLLGRIAHRVFAGLPLHGGSGSMSGRMARKVELLGNPVRSDLLPVRDVEYAPASPVRLLVFGGSQGARALNEAIMELVPRLADVGLRLQILHQTGADDHERVARCYAEAGGDGVDVDIIATPFIDDMATAYAEADLVICRSGATTLAELTVCGRPAILVPFPFAVDDHQTKNAQTLEAAGAAIHLPETELSVDRLLELLSALVNAPATLTAMARRARDCGHPAAARDIADSIDALVGGGSGRTETKAQDTETEAQGAGSCRAETDAQDTETDAQDTETEAQDV